jgi:hypothetical protein
MPPAGSSHFTPLCHRGQPHLTAKERIPSERRVEAGQAYGLALATTEARARFLMPRPDGNLDGNGSRQRSDAAMDSRALSPIMI